jgi:hypothetical protein
MKTKLFAVVAALLLSVVATSVCYAQQTALSKCGSVRELPERHRKRSPGGTPHAGQATEVNCPGVRSLILIPLWCG